MSSLIFLYLLISAHSDENTFKDTFWSPLATYIYRFLI